jgi:hypothetical protein
LPALFLIVNFLVFLSFVKISVEDFLSAEISRDNPPVFAEAASRRQAVHRLLIINGPGRRYSLLRRSKAYGYEG